MRIGELPPIPINRVTVERRHRDEWRAVFVFYDYEAPFTDEAEYRVRCETTEIEA